MASFAALKKASVAIVDDYFDRAKAAESNRRVEFASAMAIQRWYRGHMVRRYIAVLRWAAVIIQKAIRRYVARCRYMHLVEDSKLKQTMEYCNKAVIEIQRMFRGFYSRKYIHNYYARQRYLRNVMEASEHLREAMHVQLQEQMEAEVERKNEEVKNEFLTVAGSMHHLLSTKQCPGIYNSPYTGPPTVNDVPLEDHLRRIRIDHVRTEMANPKPKSSSDASSLRTDQQSESERATWTFTGPFKPPHVVERIKAMPFNPSLQNSAPYHAVKDADAQDARLEKATRLGGEVKFGGAPLDTYVSSAFYGSHNSSLSRTAGQTKTTFKAFYTAAKGDIDFDHRQRRLKYVGEV
eukprot:GFYU01003147.1.p1 GENE.GFYU01003147.1~~GFYU01003147.1.p1  ORF type:complete len:350 (+),score=63.26 GFYU01003147.1:119-1168(+)